MTTSSSGASVKSFSPSPLGSQSTLPGFTIRVGVRVGKMLTNLEDCVTKRTKSQGLRSFVACSTVLSAAVAYRFARNRPRKAEADLYCKNRQQHASRLFRNMIFVKAYRKNVAGRKESAATATTGMRTRPLRCARGGIQVG
jgi:hypothetical protein